MLDFTHIVSQQQTTTIFYAQSGSWQTWNKPRNAKMIQIFCLGGGGAGATNGGSGIGNGGRGGGSGGIVRGLVPAFLLPDVLYIQVGAGGLSGATTLGAAGGNGGISYVSIEPTSSANTVLVASSATVALGGSGFSGGGTGATIATTANAVFSNLGIFTAVAGVAGINHNNGTGVTGSLAALSSNIVTGGCGGGSRTGAQAGGTVFPASAILLTQLPGGEYSPSGIGGVGRNGYYNLIPFCSTGGSGGGAGVTGSRGGDGAYGSGGGGGGGGTGVNFAVGGNGGDGLVIITVIT
jgi:hypothetical protein